MQPGEKFAAIMAPQPSTDAKAVADAVDRQTVVLARIATALEKIAAQWSTREK